MDRSSLRWLVIGIFVLSTSLNYLDRQLVAALAPTLKTEFQLNNADYGRLQSAFFIVYAVMAPFAGWFVDRVGLNLGTSIAVTVWSLASAATGLFRSFSGLIACRTVLGLAEAASIPSTGKANASYLASHELALGAAINNIGLSLGSIGAPLIVAALAPRYGWRFTFALCGALGFLWVPLWQFSSRRVPVELAAEKSVPVPMGDLLRDIRFWGLAMGNALVMAVFALWTNWTTLYFVQERHMTQDQANQQFVWIPTLFGIAGGFTGGGIVYWWSRRGVEVIAARIRVCWIGAVILLTTAAIPLMPTGGLAAAMISLSFFWTLALSTNLYALPIDLFGAGRAAFSVASLTCLYGLMQAFVSPVIGMLVDHVGFTPVCVGIAVLPLAGVSLLLFCLRREHFLITESRIM